METVTPNVLELASGKHERFFEARSGSFLFASLYAEVYADVGTLIFEKNGTLSVFLRSSWTNRTRIAWAGFCADENRFSEYRKSFETFLDRAPKDFETFASADPTPELSERFFSETLRFFGFYRHTEFFHTDEAYARLDDRSDPVALATLSSNLRELESLKTRGRNLLISIFNGSDCFLSRHLRNVSKASGIPFSVLERMSHFEIERRTAVSDEADRSGEYAVVSGSEGIYFAKGEPFEVLVSAYAGGNVPTESFRGTTACAGRVEWKAWVIPADFDSYDDLSRLIDEMPEWAVLVTETTSPDLMLACRKASAIVTNQGGIGSHAAIVSREFRIPCVVWTKIATKALSSGDHVLVDADSWTVKILRKAP